MKCNNSNITTVAGANSNISTVAGAVANINTTASNIAGVNSFAERYRVASSDPSSSLDEGDLAYNTSSNALKYYNGSSWASVGVNTDETSKVSSNDSTAGYLNGKLTQLYCFLLLAFILTNAASNCANLIFILSIITFVIRS